MGKREKVESTAAQVERHPAAVMAAAVGQVVNGIVHIIIGLIAIGVARGAGGTADQGGAMRAIDSTPLGSVGLWIAGIALFALALHSFAVAIGEVRNDKKEAVKAAGRGVAYAAVGGMAVIYANGGSSDGEETASSVSAQLMATTWGSWLLAITGLVVLAVGVAMIVKGVRKKFLEDVDVSGQARRVFTAFGMTGYIAKGISVGIIGILFVLAVINNDPDEAGGMDGALKKLTELPYGTILLIIVGVGLITYGVYCFARAKAMARKARR